MNISEIKDLLAQFDASTLREFSYKNNGEELNLSKNQTSSVAATPGFLKQLSLVIDIFL